jgi:TP901 family phage tail tape measure protein
VQSELSLKLTFNPALDVAKLNVMLRALKDSLGPLGKDVKLIDGKKLEGELRSVAQGMKETEKDIRAAEGALLGFEKAGKKAGQNAPDLGRFFKVNQMVEGLRSASGALTDFLRPGVDFESSLAAVGAVTGQSGAALEDLGVRARSLAVTFGSSATSQLESFQGILSKLGPQVAENAGALEMMGRNVNILSKASGDDAKTSMNAIVDAMLQFGLVTGDAAKDAETSTRIINGLAASAKVGAAEIPQVAQAILQAGVAASGANMSFEATNAALQVLAVGGKTGAEAGVALRNVIGLLQNASGPAAEAMGQMGTSSKELGELLTTKGLDAALAKLRDGMKNLGTDAERNSALMKIFGMENSAAAGIMLRNLDQMKTFEQGIVAGQQGVGSAFEQAAVRMNTAQGSMDRVTAWMQDKAIGVFNIFGSTVTATMGIVAQLGPQLASLANVKAIIPDGTMEKARAGLQSMLPTIQKISPALVRTGADGAMAFAGMGKAALAFAMNPYVLAIAAVAGLVTAIHYLAGANHEAASERQGEMESQLRLIEQQKAEASSKLALSENTKNLTSEYILLAKQLQAEGASSADAASKKERLANITEQLDAKYPGVIKRTGDLATNLQAVENMAKQSGDQVAKYTSELQGLDNKAKQLNDALTKNAVAVSKENLENSLVNEASGITGVLNKTAEFFNMDSTTRKNVREWMGGFTKEIESAKSADQLKDATSKWIADAMSKVDKGEFTARQAELAITMIKNVEKAQQGWIDRMQQNINAAGAKLNAPTPPPPPDTIGSEIEKLKGKKKGLEEVREKIVISGRTEAQYMADNKGNLEAQENVQKRIDLLEGKNKKEHGKDAFELAKKAYENERKRLDAESKLGALSRETQMIVEDRTATSKDELVDAQEKLKTLESQRTELQRILKVGADGKIGIAFKNADERADADQMVTDMNNAITEAQNTVGRATLKVGVDEQALKDELRSMELDRLSFEISLGIKEEPEMLAALEADLKALRERISAANDTERRELEKKELDLEQKVQASRKRIYDEKIKDMEYSQQREEELASKLLDRIKTLDDALRTSIQNAGAKLIDKSTAAQLDALERQKAETLKMTADNEDAKAAVEQAFAARREAIEKSAENRRASIEARARGMEIIAANAREAALLEIKRNGIEQRLAEATKQGDAEAVKNLSRELDTLQKTIAEKKDPLLAITDELATGLQEGLGNMFGGNMEGMVDSFRGMLSTVVGMLERLASAAIVKLVLDWLVIDPSSAALPWFVKIGLIPVMNAAASGLVNALIGPILGNILSFSTGGRVDSPTLAVIGDASRSRAGADTEWVTRDKDIAVIARMAAAEMASPMEAKLDILIGEIRVLQQERTVLRGTDLVRSYDRTAALRDERART